MARAADGGLTLWIDATAPGSHLELFGMTLLERVLRAALEAGLAPRQVLIEHTSGASPEALLPDTLRQRLAPRFVKAEGSAGARLARAAAATPGPLLALEGGAVIDPRLLAHLASRDSDAPLAVLAGEGVATTAVLYLPAPPAGWQPGSPPEPGREGEDLVTQARAWLDRGLLRRLPVDEVPAYIAGLRRDLPAYAFRVPDAAARDRAEHFLFWSNYKGSTDFFTRHVYPPLVWRAVRPLARWRVHPNWVSGFNVVITFAAVPLFAAGQWVAGLLLAYTMSVLDSVDGKLARLTYRASKLGHVLDHGLDVVHPPFWYAAWAWALAEGDPTRPVFQAALGMTVLYFLDRIVTQCFTWATGKSIHSFEPIDVRLRTFISRRNINVPVFTVGLLVGAPVAAFAVVVAWQAATLLFHTVRLLQLWLPPPLGSLGSGASGRGAG